MRPWFRRESRRLQLAASLWLLSGACGEAPTTAAATTPLGPVSWRAHARRQLLRESCRAGGRLRRCAAIDRDRCEHLLRPALARCDDALGAELPAQIEPDDRVRLDQWQGCAWHHVGIALIEAPQPIALDLQCLLAPTR